MISTSEWAQLSVEERRPTSRFTMQLILGNVIAADEADTFDSRADRHLVRHPVDLDEEGWAKIAAAFDDLTELILATQAECANRIAADPGTPTVPAVAALLFFERAPSPR
jgi:ribosomal protein L16 Arg81 hydroxylase